MQSLPPVTQRQLAGTLLPEWVRHDSDAARAFVQEIPSASGRALVLKTGLEQYSSDQEKADFKKWAYAQADSETRAQVPQLKEMEASQ